MTSPVFLIFLTPPFPIISQLFYYLNCNQFVEPQFALYFWNHFHKKRLIVDCPRVNFSPILPKIVGNYPHIVVENLEITMASYFWDWYHEKVLPNQLKSLSNLTFSQMFFVFVIVSTVFCWAESEWHWRKALFWFWQWQNM